MPPSVTTTKKDKDKQQGRRLLARAAPPQPPHAVRRMSDHPGNVAASAKLAELQGQLQAADADLAAADAELGDLRTASADDLERWPCLATESLAQPAVSPT